MTVEKRLKDLGIDPAQALTVLNGKGSDALEATGPAVAVFFGGGRWSESDDEIARNLLARSVPVIPVVPTLDGYGQTVPPALAPINGMISEDGQMEDVAARVLECLSLLRQTRRLFISYRRLESRRIAIQLYEELGERGFDVFLDTHGVRPGEPFQEVLWHRLSDADVMVLLDTPGFLDSRWTEEELGRAAAVPIGILQIVWPDQVRAPRAEVCIPEYLGLSHFENGDINGELTKATITRIAVQVERLRARALAARHAALVREFCLAALDAGLEPNIQPERFISVLSPKGEIAAIPAIGVPDAFGANEIADRMELRVPPPGRAVILYDHRGIRDQWCRHLEWLDKHLPISSVSVVKAVEWLRAL